MFDFFITIDSTLLLSLAIVISAIIFEDLTTVVVGMLAADGVIALPLALLSLILGSFIGDALLYTLGAFARSHPRLARYIDHDATLPFRSWLGNRYAFTVFSGHFVPGLRATTYAASGFFRSPLPTYIPMALASGLIVVTALFILSYWFGSFTSTWVGHARWGVALVFVLAIFFLGRHNLAAYRNRTASAAPVSPPYE